MLNFSFNEFSENPSLDLYPEDLRAQIDDLNQVVYDGFNNGVYKSGFATKQEAYSKNCLLVFETLDKMEQILEKNDYLVGNRFTEADVRAFVTSVRFDPVYFGHFKCNLKSIEHGYPSVLKWMKRIYNHSYPKIANTINMDHIKHHYYCSHIKINPTQIVPLSNGPNLRE
jgi:glutathionyl-hydroquinone reductase